MPEPVTPQALPMRPSPKSSPWFVPTPPAAALSLSLSLPADYFEQGPEHGTKVPFAPAAEKMWALDMPQVRAAKRAPVLGILASEPFARFHLSGPRVDPSDPLRNPAVTQVEQAAPQTFDLGPMAFSKFSAGVQGLAVGPMFGGLFTPDGLRLSAGLFANIPGLGSGVAAWRF